MSKWNCFGGTFQAVNEALGRMFNKGIGEDNLDKKVTELLYHQFKNHIINGNFDPAVGWQRGTSFTLNSAETKYTADRWRCTQGTSGAGTVSYQAVTPGDVPGAIGSLRWQQTTAATTAPEIMQPVESVYTFAGSVCTLSLWIKAAATTTIQVALRQNFGTGGTPSASVDIAAQSFTVGTVWQRITATFTVPSIAGKTLGTNGNDYLGVRIILPVGATFDVQFALVQLESGSLATEFEWRQPREQLADEQRYYQKITPGLSSTYYRFASGFCSGTNFVDTTLHFPSMRTQPSISAIGSFRVYTGNAQQIGVSNITFNYIGTSGACCVATTSTSVTPGWGAQIMAANTTNAYILLDAEFYN